MNLRVRPLPARRTPAAATAPTTYFGESQSLGTVEVGAATVGAGPTVVFCLSGEPTVNSQPEFAVTTGSRRNQSVKFSCRTWALRYFNSWEPEKTELAPGP